MTSFFVGMIAGVMCFGGALAFIKSMQIAKNPLSERIKAFAGAVLLNLLGGYAVGMFSYDEMMPQLMAWQEERGGMYMALRLRNDLGLGDEQGGLLPFSSADALDSTTDEPSKTNRDKLTEVLLMGEAELITLLGKANNCFRSYRQEEISFRWPLPETEQRKILNRLEAGAAIEQDPPSREAFRALITELGSLMQKEKLVREMFSKAVKLSLDPSLFVQLMTTTRYFYIPASFNSSDVSVLFARAEQIPWAQVFEEKVTLAASIARAQLSKSDRSRESELYRSFANKVEIRKGQLETGKRLGSIADLLDLPDGCSAVDFRKAHRQYLLAIHPDKVKNTQLTQEATQLFQLLNKLPALREKEVEHMAPAPS